MIKKAFTALIVVALIVLTCVACKCNEAAIICGNCATRLPESSLYCSGCGALLFQNNVNTPTTNDPTITTTSTQVTTPPSTQEPTQPPTQAPQPTTLPTTQPTESQGTSDVWHGVVATSGSQLNIRSGPSYNYPVVGRLENGDSVTIVERKTVHGLEWGRIEKGWIFLDYISFDTPNPPATEIPHTHNYTIKTTPLW